MRTWVVLHMRPHTRRFLALLGLVASVAACRESIDAGGGLAARRAAPLFQTDSQAYTLAATSIGYEGRIRATFTNRTESPAYFVNCNGATAVRFERLVDGVWDFAWAPAMSQCLSPPIVVPPGGSHVFVIAVFGGYEGSNTFPQFASSAIAGEYRAVWDDALRSYQDRLPFGEPLPLASRVSNTFRLAGEAREER